MIHGALQAVALLYSTGGIVDIGFAHEIAILLNESFLVKAHYRQTIPVSPYPVNLGGDISHPKFRGRHVKKHCLVQGAAEGGRQKEFDHFFSFSGLFRSFFGHFFWCFCYFFRHFFAKLLLPDSFCELKGGDDVWGEIGAWVRGKMLSMLAVLDLCR